VYTVAEYHAELYLLNTGQTQVFVGGFGLLVMRSTEYSK